MIEEVSVSATASRDTAMKYATYLVSTVIISRFVDNDLAHDGEASRSTRYNKLFENRDQHSDRKTVLVRKLFKNLNLI